MERAFLEGPGVRSVRSICEEIERQTGERIDDSAIYRYREYWLAVERPFIEARQEADGMLAALKNHSTREAEELIRQRLTVAQLLAAKRFDASDPVELGYLAQGEKRIEIQQAKLSISRERLKIEQQKVAALEKQVMLRERQLEQAREKAAAAEKKVEAIGRKKKIDAETLRVIKEEIYGIVEPAR